MHLLYFTGRVDSDRATEESEFDEGVAGDDAVGGHLAGGSVLETDDVGRIHMRLLQFTMRNLLPSKADRRCLRSQRLAALRE